MTNAYRVWILQKTFFLYINVHNYKYIHIVTYRRVVQNSKLWTVSSEWPSFMVHWQGVGPVTRCTAVLSTWPGTPIWRRLEKSVTSSTITRSAGTRPETHVRHVVGCWSRSGRRKSSNSWWIPWEVLAGTGMESGWVPMTSMLKVTGNGSKVT